MFGASSVLRPCGPGVRVLSRSLGWQLHPGIGSLLHRSAPANHIQHIALRSASTLKEAPRTNPVGIQYLSNSLQEQVFGGKGQVSKTQSRLSEKEKDTLLSLSKQLLRTHDLLDKKTTIVDPIAFEIPKRLGGSLDEHFQKLGHFASEPYKSMALAKYTKCVPRPKTWLRQPGWTRYAPGEDPQQVPFPLEDVLTFDVETLYKISHFPTLATALSDKAWYAWCSPYICGGTSYKHLIPLDTANKTQLVVGHNVGYDRARVLEEYNFSQSRAFFLDTQSLHIASSGLCSRQRPMFMKRKTMKKDVLNEDTSTEEGLNNVNLKNTSIDEMEEQDPWMNVSTMNSLADVAKFHCGITMDKAPRDYFEATDKEVVIDNFQMLVDYCATDVQVTSAVFDKVFPLFLQKCPHPVSFGALRSLSSCILPTNHKSWDNYISESERLYQSSKTEIEDKIIRIVEDAVKLRDFDTNPESRKTIESDPWLRQLDWTIKPMRLTKKGLPMKRQKLPGYPEWYRSMFPNNTVKRPHITLKSRTIPLFFKLSWESHPVVWTKESGWCFPVPVSEIESFKAKNYMLAEYEAIEEYRTDFKCPQETLFKVPHPNGPTLNCTTLLSKPYIHFFDKGVLKSESEFAHEALQINASGSYWMSARERIMSQFVVKQEDFSKEFKFTEGYDSKVDAQKSTDLGIILPKIIPMGTVTRRAVENTWLTASNAKANRIGSELKTQVKAPPGYCFVGADVDSEELWIASLVGDSVFNLHGGTAIGWMCLEGTKSAGTDLHTKTAKILGCSRNEAKIFNYGRIYGAGVKFAGTLLKRFNPTLTDEEVKRVANNLYENTKGKKRRSKIFEQFWYGGSESILFNKLENIAEQAVPRTPVLGCSITSSLMKQNLKANSFLPSRINWAIQSSGVDYLHLLCCSMNYLIEKYSLDARLCISIHDEIRYMASEKDKYRVAMALQISNLWTRAIFCEQMGIDDLPQNCAFFSAVDIDTVLRKEVDMDCITPSNPNAIPHGESLDIQTLLSIPESKLGHGRDSIDASSFPFERREPVFDQYNKTYTKEFIKYFIRMQVQSERSHISELERDYVKEITAKEFSKDNIHVEYDFNDYVRDIGRGKKKKINIMVQAFMENNDVLEKQHSEVLHAEMKQPPTKSASKLTQHKSKPEINATKSKTKSTTNTPQTNKTYPDAPQSMDYTNLHELAYTVPSAIPTPQQQTAALNRVKYNSSNRRTTSTLHKVSKPAKKSNNTRRPFKPYIKNDAYSSFYQSMH
ncbi:DNA-directed DNA polymerase gamma [Maudiozyma humilis]|uniref:DNA polymerase gamma n=1 Tax=Maudiozyma humilis TaxID=51915 RepID=A0AAV5S5Y3_MAUHU|nr:DNA-directed DNA polymerase gamma [Kazachstania humilis]